MTRVPDDEDVFRVHRPVDQLADLPMFAPLPPVTVAEAEAELRRDFLTPPERDAGEPLKGSTVHPVCPHGCGGTFVRLDEHFCPARAGWPKAWAVVSETGAVDDGRIWRHRDKAERFHNHVSRNPDREYRIVPLYAAPAPVRVTEEQRDALVFAVDRLHGDAYQRLANAFGVSPYQMHTTMRDNTVRVVNAILTAASKGVGE